MEAVQGRTRGSKRTIEAKQQKNKQIKDFQNQKEFMWNNWKKPGNGRRRNDIVVRNNKIVIPKQEIKPEVDTNIPEYSLHDTVENEVENDPIVRVVKEELDLPVEDSVECAKEVKLSRARKKLINGLQNLGECSSAKKVCSLKVEQVEKNRKVDLKQIESEAYMREEIDSGNLENFQGERHEQNGAIEVIDLSVEEPFEVIDLVEREEPTEIMDLEEEEDSFVPNANINLSEENALEAVQEEFSVHTCGNNYNVNCHPNQKNLEEGEIVQIHEAIAGSSLSNLVNQYESLPSSSKAVKAEKFAKLYGGSINGVKSSNENRVQSNTITSTEFTEGHEVLPSGDGHNDKHVATFSTEIKPLAEIHANCQEQLPNPKKSGDLADCKSTLLFSQVLKILWENLKYSRLSRPEFLTTRMVCSVCMQAVDQIEEGPTWDLQFEEKIILQRRGVVRWRDRRNVDMPISIHATDSVQNIVRASRPPVTLKVIDYLNWSETDRRTRCWEFITKFLETHGEVLKVFAYNKDVGRITPINCHDPESFFKVFISWLTLMPNLREINLLECKNIYKLECTSDFPEFPTLTKLRHLNDYHWPPKLFKAAVLANTQIQNLTISNKDFHFQKITLPQLKKLVLNLVASSRINPILHAMQDYIRTLPLLNAPCLESLIFKGPVDLEIYPLVLRAMRKFSSSLQNVEFTLNFRCPGKDYVLPNLTSLTNFVLNFSPGNNWYINDLLRFIRPCSALQSLALHSHSGCFCKNVDCSYLTQDKNYQREHIQTELVSKLWNAFSNLKEVEVIPDKSSNTAMLDSSHVFHSCEVIIS